MCLLISFSTHKCHWHCQGLVLGAIMERVDVEDVLLVRDDYRARGTLTLADLPEVLFCVSKSDECCLCNSRLYFFAFFFYLQGSVVGTSSLRRRALLARAYPHLRVNDIRGNLQVPCREKSLKRRPMVFGIFFFLGRRDGTSCRLATLTPLSWLQPESSVSVGVNGSPRSATVLTDLLGCKKSPVYNSLLDAACNRVSSRRLASSPGHCLPRKRSRHCIFFLFLL